MRPAKILVIDDEPHLVKLVRSNLEAQHFKVISAMDGPSGLAMAEKEGPDLIILDIMLPGMDGFDVLQKIREFSAVPVVMLTAKDQEVDVVKGLRLGADDYLKKPFSVHELLARVEAVLRRAAPSADVISRPPFVCDDFIMDFQQRRVTVRGKDVKLGPTEYKLLTQL